MSDKDQLTNSNQLTHKDQLTRKRKVFTIGDKILIIRDLERGTSQSKLARELNIQQSTVSRMWKNRDKIISAFQNDQLKCKRLRSLKNGDDSLSGWLNKKPLALQPKPEPGTTQSPNETRSQGSQGWLQKFAVKHNVVITSVAVNGGPYLSNSSNSQLSITPNSQLSITPNSQLSITPNSQLSITPNSQLSITPNSQLSITPNSQLSLTPNSHLSITPNSHISIKPSSQLLVTANSHMSITSNPPTHQASISVVAAPHTTDWLGSTWQSLRRYYLDKDIFHIDETGLFFRLTPDKTMTCLGEHCFGGKLANERLTVVVGTNLTGSEKRRLLVVGKHNNPQLLKNVKVVPVGYFTNHKAWMTSEMFESELHQWDQELKLKGRRIMLLVSDCSAHPRMPELKFIKLVYLPYHVAAVRQPMGRGIFRSFKTQYRRLLLLKLIDYMDRRVSPVITVMDAIQMLFKAWLRVPVEMIKSCFQQTGLTKSTIESSLFEEYEDDIPLSLWLRNCKFSQFDNCKDTIDWYVEVDSELQTSEEVEERDLDDQEAEDAECDLEVKQDSGEFSDNQEVSFTEALRALRKVSKFFEQQTVAPDVLENVLSVENTLEKMILNSESE